jgi:hypothetical protein
MPAPEIWVVLDPSGDVVMMCSGEDAEEVVADWQDRGFRVVRLASSEVSAA